MYKEKLKVHREDSVTTSVDCVNARINGETANIRVMLEYLPR